MGSFENGCDLWEKEEAAGSKNRRINTHGYFHWLKSVLQTKRCGMTCRPDAKIHFILRNPGSYLLTRSGNLYRFQHNSAD